MLGCRSLAGPEQLDNPAFLFEREFFGELDVELDDEVATLGGVAAERHTLAGDDPAGLRGDDFVEVEGDELAVEFFLRGEGGTSMTDRESSASIRLTCAVYTRLSPSRLKFFSATSTIENTSVDCLYPGSELPCPGKTSGDLGDSPGAMRRVRVSLMNSAFLPSLVRTFLS